MKGKVKKLSVGGTGSGGGGGNWRGMCLTLSTL